MTRFDRRDAAPDDPGREPGLPEPGRRLLRLPASASARPASCSIAAPGVAGRLRQCLPLRQVDAFVISHLHPDHYFDLVPVFYVLRYLEPSAELMPLYVPPDGRAHLRRLGELASGEPDMFESRSRHPRVPGRRDVHRGRPASSRFHPVQHYVPSHAIRVLRRRPAHASSSRRTWRRASWLVDAARERRPVPVRGGHPRAQPGRRRPDQARPHDRGRGGRGRARRRRPPAAADPLPRRPARACASSTSAPPTRAFGRPSRWRKRARRTRSR